MTTWRSAPYGQTDMPDREDFLNAALRYSKLGLAVVPLIPGKKRPLFENWTNLEWANDDTVKRWWASTPTANVGILTGRKSGLFVLDVDTKNNGDLTYESLVSQHGKFPSTWQQTTGTGGFHLFFRYPSFPVNNHGGLFAGIDIRGDGGQVVAPPSIHPDTGRTYEWDGMAEIENTPLAEAPPWLLEILDHKGGTNKPLFMTPEKIPHGVQHHTLLGLAGMMRRIGMSASEIEPALQMVNTNRCEHPGPPENIRKIADSMMRYRPADHNLYSTATKLWRLTRKAEHDQQRELERLSVVPIDGLAVYRSQLPGPSMVIDRMLYNGLTILAGKSKAGKSFLALQIALSTAMGNEVFGDRQVLRPGGVIYYSLEMGENRTSVRMRQLLDREYVTLQNLEFIWDCLPMTGGGLAQLDLLLESKKPNLVIIDTFLAFVKGKSKEGGDVLRDQYGEIDTIKKLADKHHTAFLLVHHTRKSSAGKNDNDGGVDLVAGSRGVTAACDAIWIFQKQPDEYFSLEITGRDVEEQKLALKFNKSPFGWKLLGDADDVRLRSEEEEVLKLLVTQGPQKEQKVGAMMKTTTMKALEILIRLHRDGRVGKHSGGSYYAVIG